MKDKGRGEKAQKPCGKPFLGNRVAPASRAPFSSEKKIDGEDTPFYTTPHLKKPQPQGRAEASPNSLLPQKEDSFPKGSPPSGLTQGSVGMIKPNGRKSGNGFTPERHSPAPNFNLDKDSLNGDSNGNGSFLRQLRKEKGLSQRDLAERCGIPRTSLQRMEEMPWQAITWGELELLSKGLGLKAEEIFHRFNGFGKNGLVRLDEKNPCFILNFGEGIQYASDLHHPQECFIGTLTLSPQKTLPKEDTPRGGLIYFKIQQGLFTITQAGKTHVFKPGERFYLKEPQPYELYNPHQFEKLVASLVTLPSFIKTLH